MHQNTILTPPDVKKSFFKDLNLVVWKCIKTRFNHSRGEKNFFYDLILWSGSMRKCIKTRFTTPDVKNNFWRTWFWWSGNASKHNFNHSRGEKNIFLRTWFWWSGSTHKCIKTRFLPLQTLKKSFLRTWFWWPGNASKHVFNNSRGEKNIFLRTWFWRSEDA